MKFALNKYTLTYFTRRRGFDLQTPANLQGVAVIPTPTVQILGVKLDTKLNWKAHERAVQAKMDFQMLALQRTTASTWGATMPKARHVYQAVVRSALAYGSPVWHQPATSKAKGVTAKL